MACGNDSRETSGDQISFEQAIYRNAVQQNENMAEIDNAIGHEPSLTAAQQSKLRDLSNTVHDHLTPDDFTGTTADLQGNPIPKPGGGYWNHEAEMQASYKSITKIDRSLTKMLGNPNLCDNARALLSKALTIARSEKSMIENLYAQYGGKLQ